jgi:membrane protease YdiL (CAAX protease family)
MSTLENIIRRHPLTAYFTVTFAISWGCALVAIGGSGQMRGTTPASDPRFAYAVMAMLVGPSVTGVGLTVLVSGRAGLRAFRSRLLTWRVAPKWYAAALLTAPLVMAVTLLALSSISPAFLPGILTSDQRASILLAGFAVGLSAGFFEELGWTGFGIPTMRQHTDPLRTGLVVGLFWSAWHLLPNVWSARAAAADLPVSIYLATIAIGIFVGYLTAFRVLMVWIYDRTQSVLVGMLMHASFTASLLILNPVGLAGARLVAYSFALAGAIWLVVAAVAITKAWRVARRESGGVFRSVPKKSAVSG